MQPGKVQGLVRVDITKARKECLVEEKGLEAPVALAQAIVEHLGGESTAEWLGTQAAGHALGPFGEPDASELTCIGEDQAGDHPTDSGRGGP